MGGVFNATELETDGLSRVLVIKEVLVVLLLEGVRDFTALHQDEVEYLTWGNIEEALDEMFQLRKTGWGDHGDDLFLCYINGVGPCVELKNSASPVFFDDFALRLCRTDAQWWCYW